MKQNRQQQYLVIIINLENGTRKVIKYLTKNISPKKLTKVKEKELKLDDDIIKGLLKKFPYYDTPDLYEQSVKLIIFEKIEKILEEIILSNIVEEVITKSINTALNNIIDE